MTIKNDAVKKYNQAFHDWERADREYQKTASENARRKHETAAQAEREAWREFVIETENS